MVIKPEWVSRRRDLWSSGSILKQTDGRKRSFPLVTALWRRWANLLPVPRRPAPALQLATGKPANGKEEKNGKSGPETNGKDDKSDETKTNDKANGDSMA